MNVRMPDGTVIENVPDGITQSELMRRYAKMHGASQEPAYDPTADMSFADKAAAGFGKAIVDTGRGLRQLGSYVGIGDKAKVQADIDEAKAQDAPLMNTGAGIVGNVAGNLATMIGPSAALGLAGKAAQLPMLTNAARVFMLPKTVAGAAAQGVGMGAIQPVASDESRLFNMGVGGIGGAAVPAAIAGGRAVKGLVDPFTGGGRERITARALERFAADPQSILRAGSQELVPGSLPTLAESTQDVGLAQLQRSLRNNPDANSLITNRLLQQNDARLAALKGIAGDQGQREFFAADRSAVAQKLYGQAFNETPKVTPWVRGQITQLQKRPSFQEALPQAQALAQEEGLRLDPSNVVQVSHYTKMALDDMISTATGNKQRALIGTRDKLVSLMESKDFAPSYREARTTFAEMSKPINQMDIGQELVNKFQPALAEYGATGRTTPAKFAEALRSGDQTAKRATGFSGAKMENILTPEQYTSATNVAKDVARSSNAQELGMARGSPTGQNLISQDIMRQMLGPFGLPKSIAESTLAETLLRPVSFAYKAPETRVMGLLADAALSPEEARRLYIKELSKRRHGADNLIPYGAGIGTAGLLGLAQ